MAIKNKFVMQGNNQDYGHKNFILNGDFQVWQRGTSFVTPGTTGNYCADNWQYYRTSNAAGMTVSRQTNSNLRSIRAQRDSGNTNTGFYALGKSFESIETAKFAGKTVTLQFKAKCGANFSPISSALNVTVQWGTGTEASIMLTGFTGGGNIISYNQVLTSSFVTYTATFVVPSTATQFGIYWMATPIGTAGANDYFELTDVQLEVGSFATAFERRLYGMELLLCQRYHQQSSGAAGSGVVQGGVLIGYPSSTNNANVGHKFPVIMRTTPTVTTYNNAGTVGLHQSGVGDVAGVASNIDNHGIMTFTATGTWYNTTAIILASYTATAEL